MTTTRIRARLLIAVLAIAACLALAPVTALASQTSTWSITSVAAFGMAPGGDQGGAAPGGDGPAAPGGDAQGQSPFGGEGMPAAPGAENGEAADAAAEETEEESAWEALKNTLRSYRDYAIIHPVRVFGSMAALVIGLIIAFAYRKRA